jgi:uroporphyrinogen III methyltransferase / synthase
MAHAIRTSPIPMTQSQGKVDILGAGPGAPEFLTLAGQQIIAQAEVLIYDALIDPRLLTIPKRNCEFLEMGKRGGQASSCQAEINQQLINACLKGKRVVRLKAGDPFIFGRTISEVKALEAAGCLVTVWPGLSSVFAAPLLAGIPLTDRELGQSLVLLSGHFPDQINWPVIAQIDTLVIVMGTRNLFQMSEALIQAGKPKNTPMAVIRWGSWPQQECWFGRLETLAGQLATQDLSPAVVVVGQVVSLRQTMQIQPCIEFNQQPLSGKTILVTRAAEQASFFRDRLQSLGARVLEMPALEIVAPSNWQGLDEAIAAIDQFDWLILTSANAVDYFFQRLQTQGKDSRALSQVKIAVVGKKTATQLENFGIVPDYIPPNFVADSLITHFPEVSLEAKRILFPRVESGGRDVLVQEFRSRRAQLTEVAAYQSICPPNIPEEIIKAFKQQSIDAVTFASSKTVHHFNRLLTQALEEINPGQTEAYHSVAELLDSICIASIGPQTSKSCVELFNKVSLEPQEYTLEGLAQEIVTYFSEPQP